MIVSNPSQHRSNFITNKFEIFQNLLKKNQNRIKIESKPNKNRIKNASKKQLTLPKETQ